MKLKNSCLLLILLFFLQFSMYTLCTSNTCNAFSNSLYANFPRSASGNSNLDENTIFERHQSCLVVCAIFKEHGIYGPCGSEFKFRNPPSFLPNLGETYTYRGSGFSSKFINQKLLMRLRLDHVFEHKNTHPSFHIGLFNAWSQVIQVQDT